MLEFLFTHPCYSERKVRCLLWPAIWQVTEFLWGELHFEDEINVIEGYVDRLIGIDELRAISLIHTPDELPNEDE